MRERQQSSVSQSSRGVAIACSFVSGAWGIFWLIRVIRERGADLRGVVVFVFPIVSVAFALAATGRRISVVGWLPFLALSAAWAWKSFSRGQTDVVWLATFATLLAFMIAGSILERRRRDAVQQAVAADGASPRR
jgi:hypothetical protein